MSIDFVSKPKKKKYNELERTILLLNAISEKQTNQHCFIKQIFPWWNLTQPAILGGDMFVELEKGIVWKKSELERMD